jgi:hypothetical protein
MPCMDYESSSGDSSRKLKKQADKLARIACAALEELERNGVAEVLLLKNDELREWWAAHKEADRKERERVAELERRERVRQEALDRLSAEEKELLGLAPKKRAASSSVWDDEEDEDNGGDEAHDWDADEYGNVEWEDHTTKNGITIRTFKVK